MSLIRLLKNDLAKESTEWVEKGIIDEQQAVDICKEYGADYYAQDQNNFLLNVLVGLGFLFIGIALIVLIGHNWEEIPRPVRMFGLIGVTAATQYLGWRQYKNNKNTLFFFLGCLFYGASIILIAQVYHLGEHMPDGVFWWALGCLPFALLTRSLLLMLLTLVLAIIWFLIESSLSFVPWLFPVFVLCACWVLHKSEKTSLFLLIATLFGVGLTVDYSFLASMSLASLGADSSVMTGTFAYNPFDFFAQELMVGMALMILFYAVSVYMGQKPSNKAKDFSVLMRLWVLRFSVVLLITFSFEGMWGLLFSSEWGSMAVFMGFMLALLLSALWLAKRTNRFTWVAVLSGLLVLLAVMTFWAAYTDDQWTEYSYLVREMAFNKALWAQVLTNVAAVVVAVVLIVRGIADGVRQYFFMGIFLIIVIGFARYFDLIGGYIGAALLFLFFSFVLLGAAKYWKNRVAKESCLNSPKAALEQEAQS